MIKANVMRLRWRTFTAWIAAVLGLASCDKIGGFMGTGMAMYGTPNADYDINIKITDEDGHAIPGIEVTPEPDVNTQHVYSDKDGVVKTSFNGMYLELELRDVDGEENGGEFESVRVTQKELDLKKKEKGDGWYNGKFDVTGTVSMSRKKTEE